MFSCVFFSILAAPRAVEADRYGRTVLGVRLERGVGELIAGDHDLALEQDGLLVARVKQFRAQGHVAGARRLERIVGLVDHAEFERRGLAENLLHFGRVLQTGQLDRDLVDALARDLRLRHRELRAIQAVAQDHDVLLDRVILAFLDLLRESASTAAPASRRRWCRVRVRLRLSREIAALPLAKLSAS